VLNTAVHTGCCRLGYCSPSTPSVITLKITIAAFGCSPSNTPVRYCCPPFELLHGSAPGAAVRGRALNASFQDTRMRNHLSRYPVERDFEPSAPARIDLTGVCANADIHEPPVRRPLDKWSTQRCPSSFDYIADDRLELEDHSLSGRALRLDGFVCVPATFLQRIIDVAGRSLYDDAKKELTRHTRQFSSDPRCVVGGSRPCGPCI